jgi:hypothetical protein
MADLDFKHHVSQIPQGEPLPTSPGRKVAPITTHVPDFQGAVNQYAADTNWMSQLGSAVAIRASTAIATKLGGEMGKNPQGELPLPLTKFDETLAQSYATQANSTLGLQAQALISKTNLELAQKPRLSSDMIASAQKSTLQGLEKIFSMAPSSIRPNLESHYGGVMINQNEQLVEKMISQQRTDEKDKFQVSSKVAAENTYAMSLSGNDKGAEAAMNATIASAKSMHSRNIISLNEARVIEDTLRQTALTGKMTRLANQADKEKKLGEFLNSVADNPEKYNIGPNDKDAVIKNLMSNIQQDQNLRSLNERHIALEMHNRILETGGDIGGAEWAAFKEQVSPNVEAQMRLNLTTSQQRKQKKVNDTAQAIKNVTDFDNFSLNTPQQNYDAFIELTNKKIESYQSQGKNISVPEAQMQIAATLAGPIPKYMDTLNRKAASGDPLLMQEVKATIDYMSSKNAAQNLAGLSDDARSVIKKFDSMSPLIDPVERAQTAKDQIYNKKSEQNVANDLAWNNLLKNKTKKGQSHAQFAISQADIDPDSVVNIPLISQYALDKYETYFKKNNGDVQIAQELLKEDIGRTFGTTYVNGKKEFMMFPIETRGNLPNNSEPFIHQDLRDQVSRKLTDTKKLYDNGQVDFYWEFNPTVDLDTALSSHRRVRELQPHYGSYKLEGTENVKHQLYSQQRELIQAKENITSFVNSGPSKITQHFRDGHTKEYEIVIQPNQSLGVNSSKGVVGFYNVMLKAGKSTTPLLLADPSAGPPIYQPRYENIKKNYALLQYYLPPDITLPKDTAREVENLQREYLNPRL